MSIKPGDTFLFQYPDKEFHFHIVVETITSDNKALCVFVSSIKSDRGYDVFFRLKRRMCPLENG